MARQKNSVIMYSIVLEDILTFFFLFNKMFWTLMMFIIETKTVYHYHLFCSTEESHIGLE